MIPGWAKFTVTGLGLAGAALQLAMRSRSISWNAQTSRLVENFAPAVSRREVETVSWKDFDQLPIPVAHYLRWALREGQPLIRAARLVQIGELRARAEGAGWSRFEATQYVALQLPGFVWDAAIHLAPLLSLRLRDSYVAGRGAVHGQILSLLPIIDAQGRAELNAGALHRYLAETAWFPTALLPGQGIRWSAIDNNRALATLTDCGTTVSLQFHFNDSGEISGVFTPARYREVNGKYELTPWAGHFRDYGERNGMRIPLAGEVEWQLPYGSFPVWRGRIVDIAYDFAR